MILARQTYHGFDGFPAKGEFKPNKAISKIIDGRREKSAGSEYRNEDGSYFYSHGGLMI